MWFQEPVSFYLTLHSARSGDKSLMLWLFFDVSKLPSFRTCLQFYNLPCG